jgi:hypothetical protein
VRAIKVCYWSNYHESKKFCTEELAHRARPLGHVALTETFKNCNITCTRFRIYYKWRLPAEWKVTSINILKSCILSQDKKKTLP